MKRKKDCTSCINSIKLHQKKDYIWWICDLHDYRIDHPDRYCCSDCKSIPFNSKFNRNSIIGKIHKKEISDEE